LDEWRQTARSTIMTWHEPDEDMCDKVSLVFCKC
jgi:hypothetical protein